MAVDESDQIEIDGDAPNELQFKEEDGYAELVFKSCWYLMALVVFIVAGSIILMGIEGHYFMFDNLNKFEQREHFEQRLSQVRLMSLSLSLSPSLLQARRVNVARLGFQIHILIELFGTW